MNKDELMEAGKEETVKLKGRGGKENFPSNIKAAIKTEEQRGVAKQLLQETLTAYRMPKVKDDEELAQRFDDYFRMCASTGQIPTVEEMCLCTGYAQSTIWDFETGRRKGFSSATAEIIRKSKDFLQTFDAKLVVSGQLNFLTYCFRAKNYYGMIEKSEVVLTPNNPLGDVPDQKQLEAKLADIVLEAEDE